MQFLNCFRCAFRGIIYCISNERNMRIHTVVALYVFAFSFFFHLSRIAYAALFLTFAAVIMGEMFNTAAEEICDFMVPHFDTAVRRIKDMSSGAVLVAAIFSVLIGICLFWRPEVFRSIAAYYGAHPVMIAVLAATAVISIVFIVLGPHGIRDRVRKRRNKRGRKKQLG